jgi:hypothetical protein
MPGLQKEIYSHSEYFRAWKDQSFLSEVQERKSEAEYLHVYHKDKPEELTASRRRSSRGELSHAWNGKGSVFRHPPLYLFRVLLPKNP